MSTELYYLTLAIFLHLFMWIPYVLDRVMTRGMIATLSYPADPAPQSGWATRLRLAHANSTESLIPFAAVLLVAEVTGVEGAVLATASMSYFWARVVHAVAYTLAIPFIRTVAFVVGFLSTVAIAWACLVAS